MAQKKGWKLGQDSFTKMIVWFKDGNVRTMYSIDWKHKLSKTISKETHTRTAINGCSSFGINEEGTSGYGSTCRK